MKGLDSFDIVYYINLEHRKDRYEDINNELKKTNIKPSKINRINAVYYENFCELGCAKSHILALEEFLKTPENIQNCIIFEDDFIFTKNQDECNALIDNFFYSLSKFDVLMLASNTINYNVTDMHFLIKIIDAQTTSGYCVSKEFAPILLENYKTCAYLLECNGSRLNQLCLDIYMKELQPKSLWYCLQPTIGEQKESYSDIVKTNVIYNC